MHPPGHEVHPQPEQESILRTVFAGWLRFGGIFRRFLRATTKKRSSTYLAKKCTPRQNPGYAYEVKVEYASSQHTFLPSDISLFEFLCGQRQTDRHTDDTNNSTFFAQHSLHAGSKGVSRGCRGYCWIQSHPWESPYSRQPWCRGFVVYLRDPEGKIVDGLEAGKGLCQAVDNVGGLYLRDPEGKIVDGSEAGEGLCQAVDNDRVGAEESIERRS